MAKTPVTAALCAAAAGNTLLLDRYLQPHHTMTTTIERRACLVTDQDHNGDSVLHMAARNGRQNVIDLLLGHDGLDLDLRDKSGCTALIYAVLNDHVRVVTALIDAGASTDVVDLSGKDALAHACCSGKAGSTAMLELLVGAYAELSRRDSVTGSTPLHYLVEKRTLVKQGGELGWHKLKILLHAGSDPDVQNNRGQTALMRAVITDTPSSPALAAVKLIYNIGGATLGVVDDSRMSAADHALALGKPNAVEMLEALGSAPAHYRQPGREPNLRFTAYRARETNGGGIDD